MLKWELLQPHAENEAFQAFSSQQSFPKRTSSAVGFTQRTTTGLGGTTMTSETSADVSIDARRAVTTLHIYMFWIRKILSQEPTHLKLGICLSPFCPWAILCTVSRMFFSCGSTHPPGGALTCCSKERKFVLKIMWDRDALRKKTFS